MKKHVSSVVRICFALLAAMLLLGTALAAESNPLIPTKTALTSVRSNAAGCLTVKWKKNTSGTGYEIQYSLTDSFKVGSKIKVVKHSTTVAKKLKNLKQGKTYYVRIRTKKGKKRSAWSKIKAATVRKSGSSLSAA